MINSQIKDPESPFPVGEVDLSIMNSEQSGQEEFPLNKQLEQKTILQQQYDKQQSPEKYVKRTDAQQKQQYIEYPSPHQTIRIPYDKMRFVQQPIEKDGILQCQIRKICSNSISKNSKYELIIFDYSILVAEKIHTMFKRKFIIRLTDSNIMAGKVKWDKSESNFIFIDNNVNPKKCSSIYMQRACLGGANYQKLGKKKPHQIKVIPVIIQVFLPEVSENNEIYLYKPTELNYFDKIPKGFTEYKNREPVYNKETNTYNLFYYNRALLASSKNFQLCQQNENQIYFLFGKMEKGLYNLDFQWPISPIQAFQIALSCYISKARD